MTWHWGQGHFIYHDRNNRDSTVSFQRDHRNPLFPPHNFLLSTCLMKNKMEWNMMAIFWKHDPREELSFPKLRVGVWPDGRRQMIDMFGLCQLPSKSASYEGFPRRAVTRADTLAGDWSSCTVRPLWKVLWRWMNPCWLENSAVVVLKSNTQNKSQDALFYKSNHNSGRCWQNNKNLWMVPQDHNSTARRTSGKTKTMILSSNLRSYEKYTGRRMARLSKRAQWEWNLPNEQMENRVSWIISLLVFFIPLIALPQHSIRASCRIVAATSFVEHGVVCTSICISLVRAVFLKFSTVRAVFVEVRVYWIPTFIAKTRFLQGFLPRGRLL